MGVCTRCILAKLGDGCWIDQGISEVCTCDVSAAQLRCDEVCICKYGVTQAALAQFGLGCQDIGAVYMECSSIQDTEEVKTYRDTCTAETLIVSARALLASGDSNCTLDRSVE
jgi:hypothetical protein